MEGRRNIFELNKLQTNSGQLKLQQQKTPAQLIRICNAERQLASFILVYPKQQGHFLKTEMKFQTDMSLVTTIKCVIYYVISCRQCTSSLMGFCCKTFLCSYRDLRTVHNMILEVRVTGGGQENEDLFSFLLYLDY